MPDTDASTDSYTHTDIDRDYVESFQSLVNEVFRTNSLLLAISEYIGRDLEINAARWQFIMFARQKPQTVAQLARRLGVARQSVHSVANKLRDRGLIEFGANPDHARAQLVHLTDKGQALVEDLRVRQKDIADIFFTSHNVDREELKSAAVTLARMRELTQSALNEAGEKD